MTRRLHLLWPVLIALSAGACARQQPAYYVDSVTGQPVAMPQQQQTAQSRAPAERGLYNTFYSQPSAQFYQAYAQQQAAYQQQPSYQPQQAYSPPAYRQQQPVAQAQPAYRPPQTYAQPQAYQQPQYRAPAPQYYQPYQGGPYAAAPQSNPFAQARWY